MKRDMELMLSIELQNDDRDTDLQSVGYDESQIDYHLELLIEARLVVGEVHHQMPHSSLYAHQWRLKSRFDHLEPRS